MAFMKDILTRNIPIWEECAATPFVQFPRKHISYLIQLKKDIPKTENVQKIRICIL